MRDGKVQCVLMRDKTNSPTFTKIDRYPFADHTCPPLDTVVDFCESAKAWLDIDVANIVSLHCKAGKGRAGIMAACLMVRMGDTAEEAVAKYDTVRANPNYKMKVEYGARVVKRARVMIQSLS